MEIPLKKPNLNLTLLYINSVEHISSIYKISIHVCVCVCMCVCVCVCVWSLL